MWKVEKAKRFSLNFIELEVYLMQIEPFFPSADLSGFYQPFPSRVVDIVKQYCFVATFKMNPEIFLWKSQWPIIHLAV